MCYTLPEVYRLPVRTYAAIAINAPYRWRSSSHKANLIPQSKRQDTTVIVIPCLCSFNALCSPSAEFPINKKRTRTLSHRELGSSTNCLVGGTGLEQHGTAAGGAAERALRQQTSIKPGTFSGPMAQKGFRVSDFALFLCASCYRIFILQQPLFFISGDFIFWYILPCRARRGRNIPSG